MLRAKGDTLLLCIVTNTYTQPSEGTGILRIFKEVVNDNLGLRRPGDFALRIAGGTGVGGTYTPPNNMFAGVDESHGGTAITLRPGKYSVREEPSPARYAVRYSPSCAGIVAAGQTATCVVTNDDNPQPGVFVLSATLLNIEKLVIPPTSSVQRISVYIDGSSNNVHRNLSVGVGPAQGQTVTIQTGEYRVVERPVPAGYAAFYSDKCTGTLTGVPELPRTCYIMNIAVTQNNASNSKGINLTPEAQKCLQNPACIDLSHIPSSLITCLQDPECIRTLTISTSTDMTMHNLTKGGLITEYNASKSANLTQGPSTNAFRNMSNTSIMAAITDQIDIPSEDNLTIKN